MPLRTLCRLLPPKAFEASVASFSFASASRLAARRAAWTRRVGAHQHPQNKAERGVHTATQCQVVLQTKRARTQLQAGPFTLRNSRLASNAASGDLNKDKNHKKKWYKVPKKGVPPQKSAAVQSASTAKVHPKPKTTPPTENVVHFDPKLNNYEPSDTDLDVFELHTQEDYFHDIPLKALAETTNSANVHGYRPSDPPMLPKPDSQMSLHRNLLYLVNKSRPVPRFPALVDYHGLYPECQSTLSYNLLIFLAIRHHAYGIVRVLLRDQEERGISKDMETYKLIVRALIYQGLWEDAWKYIQKLVDHRVFPKNANGKVEIPLPIWLEFFCAPRKKLLRRRAVFDDNGRLLERFLEKVVEKPQDLRNRQRLLNQNRPMNMPPLANTPSYAIHCMVQLLVRSDNYDRALELTKTFFGAMPRSMKHNHVRRCLDIIHTLIVYSPAKNGLPRFYDVRKTLVQLSKLHPALRPNSRTLYLLLAPLKRAKKCGTVAWGVLRSFRKEWGRHVEDRRVQRRVSTLAVKEGRMDIVEKINRIEKGVRLYRQRSLLATSMSHGLIPPPAQADGLGLLPLRTIYPRNGREGQMWHRLRLRARFKKWRLRVRRRQRPATKSLPPASNQVLPQSLNHSGTGRLMNKASSLKPSR